MVSFGELFPDFTPSASFFTLMYPVYRLDIARVVYPHLALKFIEYDANDNGFIEEPELNVLFILALSKYQYLLKLGFHATGLHHQLKCKWPDKRKSMRPDFFLLDNRGMGHIVEFNISHTTFFPNWQSADPQSMIDQAKAYSNHTRKFRQYFDDPNNRTWFQKKYGIPVMNPRRILVIGRRREFSTSQWIDIKSNFQDLEIVNYDELLDHVLAHLVLDN